MTLKQLHELRQIGIIGDQELIEAQIDRLISKGRIAETWTRNGVRLNRIEIRQNPGLDEGYLVEIEVMGRTKTMGAGAFGIPSDRVRNQTVILEWMMESPTSLRTVLETRLIELAGLLVPEKESHSSLR